MLGDEFFAAEAVLRGEHHPVIKVMSNGRKGFFNLPHFSGHDGEVTVGKFPRHARWP